MNCTDPGHVENSVRQVLPSGPNRYSFQTAVSYNCNPGYYLLGSSILSCQGDGTWDRSLPKCLCESFYPDKTFLQSFQNLLYSDLFIHMSWHCALWVRFGCFFSVCCSGSVWSSQHASICTDLGGQAHSGLCYSLQLHRPAQHCGQYHPHVPAGWPVERLPATLLWYSKSFFLPNMHSSSTQLLFSRAVHTHCVFCFESCL